MTYQTRENNCNTENTHPETKQFELTNYYSNLSSWSNCDNWSNWKCYLFDGFTKYGGGSGLVWYPYKDCVPNWFVRFFMKIFLGCRWEKIDKDK